MQQKFLLTCLKLVLIGVAICGVVLYALVLPMYGLSLKSQYPEFSNRFWPWLIFLLISGIPCFAALVLGGKILSGIEKNMAFTMRNAALMNTISILAAADAAYFFVGNLVLLLLSMSHPGVFIASLTIVFAGLAIAVLFAVLSQLVKKAAALQEQSDLTI